MKTTFTIFVMLTLFSCGGIANDTNQEKCDNIQRENWAPVPYKWDQHDEVESYKMTNGCILTTTTHYVFDNSNDTYDGGVGSYLPVGYNKLGCQYDGCGGPNIVNSGLSDPLK